MLEVHALPVLRDNYAWLLADGRQAVVVDPGEAGPILAWLQVRGLRLSAILVTHHHADHVGGVAALRAVYDCPVYGPVEEDIPQRTHALGDGQRIVLTAPELELSVLAVPGHTRGHLAYLGHGHLFCGDTLFSCGCGRLFEGSAQQMYASLMRLAALPDTTRVCCAHEYTLANIAFARTVEPGNAALRSWEEQARARRRQGLPTLPTTLAQERQTNPFLRCDRAPVKAGVARLSGQAYTQPIEVFTALRALKDVFHA